MTGQYNFYIFSLFLSFAISGGLAIWGWRRRTAPGAAWFSALMLSAFWFTIFYGLELFSTELQPVILWSKLQYLGALNFAPLWLFLVLTYTGQREFFNRRNISLVYLIPAITLVLAWTNEAHQLIWVNPTLGEYASFNLLDFTPGVWWWINLAYANALLVAATVQLIRALMGSDHVYRRQIIVLLLFSGINWVGIILYVFGLIPQNLNPSLFTFSLGGIVVAWGLFRYRIMDLSPIARDQIIHGMQDGLIVLDAKNRIVDINPMALQILGVSRPGLVGRAIRDLLGNYPDLEEKLCRGEQDNRHAELTIHARDGRTRSFDVHTTLLRDDRGRIIGRLMFWHDITARVQQESATNLLLSITQRVSAAQDFRAAVHETLKTIVDHAGWTFGEAWIPDRENAKLVNVDASYCSGPNREQLEHFNQVSLAYTFAPGRGLPGRVWVSKQIEWQRDISSLPEDVYHRARHAQEANLRASLGIPVLSRGEVIVVLVFYMHQIYEQDPYMIDLVSAATAQLGTVLQNKRAEETMRIQSAALEASADGIVITNSKGEITWVNPAFSRLTGYSMAEIMGGTPRVLKSGQHPPEFYRDLWETISSGEPWHGEMINRRKDGTLYVEEQSITPARDRSGKITHYIAIKRDITARKQAEEQLRKLSRAVEQSGSTIVITDLDGVIEFANPAFTRITGYTLEEAIGKSTRILSSGKHSREFFRDLWDTITHDRVWHGEILNRRKNGELYWEAATISPVHDQDGNITHYLAVKEDISDRKAMEAALEQERQKTDALLKNILPGEVAEEIKQTGTVTPVLFQNASILFTDFGNFTATAEALPPQELVKLIDHYFSFFDFIVQKYHLEKLKTIGDSYMCASGLPTPSDTHAIDITLAALDMLEFVQAEKEERQQQGLPYWDMRIGISSGPVVAGVVGHTKYNYDVWGDTVVMAARMEQSGMIGRVNVSKATYELIKDHFECQYRGTVEAKHKGQVEMYFVTGRKGLS